MRGLSGSLGQGQGQGQGQGEDVDGRGESTTGPRRSIISSIR